MLVLAPTFDEYLAIRKEMALVTTERLAARRSAKGQIGSVAVVLVQSGAGKVNAASGVAYALIEHRPDVVLIAGAAGGIDPDLASGTIVVVERTAQHDHGSVRDTGLYAWGPKHPGTGRFGDLYAVAASDWTERLERSATGLFAGDSPVVRGLVVSGDVFVASEEARDALWRQWRAAAVDRETAAVAQVCEHAGVPWAAVRVVTDHADNQAGAMFGLRVDEAGQIAGQVVEQAIERWNDECISSAPLHE
ncbi:MAG: 5'-methylthioadenosine/S-adenosylhomocysteine nucleosidase [Planctomycetota bacterium]